MFCTELNIKKPTCPGKILPVALIASFLVLGISSYYLWQNFYQTNPSVQINEKAYPCVIIGSGSGGLASAVYLSQLGCKTLLLQGPKPGGALTKTQMVQNWPGEIGIPGKELIDKMQQHAQAFGTIIQSGEVTSTDFNRWPFTINYTDQGKKISIQALSCIIATGSTPKMLNIEGEEAFWGRGVSNCAICDGPMFKNETVAIIGGGDSAVTEAEILSPLAKKIFIIVRADKLRAAGMRAAKLNQNPKVEFLYNTQAKKILGNEQGVTAIQIETTDGSKKDLPIAGLFLAIGSQPNTEIFKDQVALDKYGLIKLVQDQQTTIPGVFAIGDVCDIEYRQAITAAGSGCKAALQALAFLNKQHVNLKNFPIPQPKNATTAADTNNASTTKTASESNNAQILELESSDSENMPSAEIENMETDVEVEEDDNVFEITTQQELNKLQELGRPLVLDVYAPWCMPCQFMLPIYTELAQEFKNKITFVKVNADVAPALIKQFGVRGVPTFLLFDAKNSLQERFSGQLSKEEFTEKLNGLIN